MKEHVEITVETVTRRRGVSELARRVKRNHSHVSRVLSGERKPGKDLARMLARMGVDVGGAVLIVEHGTEGVRKGVGV